MDQQRVNGAIDAVVGSARRHIGNLTGDTETQVGGVFQQFKGKVETAVGKVKDAARNAHDNAVAKQQADAELEHVDRAVVITGDRNIL